MNLLCVVYLFPAAHLHLLLASYFGAVSFWCTFSCLCVIAALSILHGKVGKVLVVFNFTLNVSLATQAVHSVLICKSESAWFTYEVCDTVTVPWVAEVAQLVHQGCSMMHQVSHVYTLFGCVM